MFIFHGIKLDSLILDGLKLATGWRIPILVAAPRRQLSFVCNLLFEIDLVLIGVGLSLASFFVFY